MKRTSKNNSQNQYKGIAIEKEDSKTKIKNKDKIVKKGKISEARKSARILSILSIVSFVLIMVVVGQFLLIDKPIANRIPRGTTINGIGVGRLSSSKASQVISNMIADKANSFELNINYLDKSWSFNKDDFEVNSNIHTIVEMAQEREAINSNYELQKETLSYIEESGSSINLAFNYLFVGLDEKIENIMSEIEIPAKNSEITFTPNSEIKFQISKESSGLRVNKEKLYEDINNEFMKSNTINVEIQTEEELPSITQEHNEKITQKLSSFKTDVADSTGARKINVKLALERVNGLIIEPGQTISFNEQTGPHSIANGYKVATIIYNGQFVDGVGGGICQASTTLYNALLLADVDILQVRKHTLPVRYVPLALDAMVSEHISDLVFKNTSGTPIYISTSSDFNSVYVEVYGADTSEYSLKTRSETICTIPHNGDTIKADTAHEYTEKVLYQGEYYRLTYPRDGYEAKSYLCYYKDRELVKEEEIRHEIYYPQNGIVIEGTEVPPSDIDIIDDQVEVISPSQTSSSNTEVASIPVSFCP